MKPKILCAALVLFLISGCVSKAPPKTPDPPQFETGNDLDDLDFDVDTGDISLDDSGGSFSID